MDRRDQLNRNLNRRIYILGSLRYEAINQFSDSELKLMQVLRNSKLILVSLMINIVTETYKRLDLGGCTMSGGLSSPVFIKKKIGINKFMDSCHPLIQ